MTNSVIRLNSGHDMPVLGFGTWPFLSAGAERAVGDALQAGYRLVDTASRYSNETGVGKAIRASGIPREEIFVTSKLRGGDQGADLTPRAIDASLANLGLGYLDLYLIHWPLPMLGLAAESWQAMAEAQRQGLIRSIGVSNFLPHHLDDLARVSDVVPAVNQIEMHPFLPREEECAYDAAHGIVTQAWSPLGRGIGLIEHPVMERIAGELGATTAQVALAWQLQRGNTAVSKTSDPGRMRANLRALDLTLTDEQMAAIAGLENGERLVESSDVHDER